MTDNDIEKYPTHATLFFSGPTSEPEVIPPKSMPPGNWITVTNASGTVIHRYRSQSFAPGAVKIGQKVDIGMLPNNLFWTTGKVLGIERDPITGLDIAMIEEDV